MKARVQEVGIIRKIRGIQTLNSGRNRAERITKRLKNESVIHDGVLKSRDASSLILDVSMEHFQSWPDLRSICRR